jgi:hypothetical protein
MFKTKTKLILSFLFVFGLVCPSLSAVAAGETLDDPPSELAVVINEIQTGGTTEVKEEFIELKNISEAEVDIGGWGLQYITSTGNLSTATIFTTFIQGTNIPVGGYLLISPSGYFGNPQSNRVDYTLTSFGGVAAMGGTVSLVHDINGDKTITQDEIIDRVGWGTTDVIVCETKPALAPIKGESIQRKSDEETIVTIDTDNNQDDFWESGSSTPGLVNIKPLPLPPADPADPEDPNNTDDSGLGGTVDEENTQPEDNDPQGQEQIVYLPIRLSELFIDPGDPLTDANDEWVEIYNPNEEPVDLDGYTIFTGATFNYHYIFSDGVILEPHVYMTVTSGESSLSLSNSGGAAKIVAPDGTILDQTTYTKATTGNAWAKDTSGNWQWTVSTTKEAANIITALPPTIKKAAAAVKKAVKTTTTKKVTSKTTKVKLSTNSAEDQEELIAAPMPLPSWLLAVLGVLAVLYCLYEYRFDVANKIHQFRLYRENRGANR